MIARLSRPPVWALALIAGAAAALAHPPFGVLPGLLGYPLLLWLIDGVEGDRPLRSAFWRGWLAGVAYFAIGTWWVAEAFLVDIVHHGWMAPFAITFLASGVALFWGAAAALYRRIAPSGMGRVVVFAGVFSALEWLRGHVLTGFPWNLPGESWRAGSALSQTAALVGAYGLTWITLACVCTAVLWREGRRGRIAVGAALAALSGLFVWGALRLHAPEPAGAAPPLRVRIVQADIKQSAKYDPAHFRRIVDAYVGLTRQPPAPGTAPADIVVWPEGAIPAAVNDYLAPDTWTRAAIEGALHPGQTLLVGAYRYEGTADRPLYFNSLIAARRTVDGLEPAGFYDKHRLVPFGEYLPLDGLMTRLGIKTLVHVGDGFQTGPAPRPLAPPGLPAFQPLICWESVYPGFTRAGARISGASSAFIVNVSNDAWFGTTSGPLQHLNIASYRAIEEGIPMIRSTPTGVSAIVDSFGRVRGQHLGLGQTGIIEAPLPSAGAKTPYRRFGEFPFLIMLLISGLYSVRPLVATRLKLLAG